MLNITIYIRKNSSTYLKYKIFYSEVIKINICLGGCANLFLTLENNNYSLFIRMHYIN